MFKETDFLIKFIKMETFIKKQITLAFITSFLFLNHSFIVSAKKTENNKLKPELVFQTGFEGTSRVLRNTNNAPAIVTPHYEVDDIVGFDHMLKVKNDWVKDMDTNPRAGEFLIEYTGGDSTQRSVNIIQEPGNPNNHVMQFWLNDSWNATENQRKARIQTDIYGIKEGFKELYQSQRVFISKDFNVLKSYPKGIGWLTISEFWNNEWWVEGEKYGFRITLGIGKQGDKPNDFHFILNAEDAGQKEVWNARHLNTNEVKVPIGKWFTLDYYIKEGNKENGRVYVAITTEGEKTQVVYDVRNFTHNTKDPAPNGITGWSPQKLYTSKEIVSYVKERGMTLEIYWDDFKLWRNKRP